MFFFQVIYFVCGNILNYIFEGKGWGGQPGKGAPAGDIGKGKGQVGKGKGQAGKGKGPAGKGKGL